MTALLLAPLSGPALAGDEPFLIQRIQVGERVIQADLVDLDGDGHGDLLWTGVEGMPPQERRTLHVHFGAPDGALPAAPDWSAPVPAGAAAYDLADLDGRAGQELLLLRRDRVTSLSLHGRVAQMRDLPVPDPPTVAVVQDERGLDRLRLARRGLGAPLRLLVPGFGRASLLEADGTPVASLDVGARANFFVPPRPGPLVSESEIEVYFDHPRLAIGDVDGDGRGDLIASDRHELRVFLQRENGGFPDEPDRRLTIGKLSEQDHIRTSGSIRVLFHDFDGDGRVDLLLASTAGSIFSGVTDLTLHRNVGGTWNLAKPDQRFPSERGLTSEELLDLDGDGRMELVSIRVPTSVLEVVEILVTRAIDAEVTVYRRGKTGLFEIRPWFELKEDVGISFETLRSTGFVPTAQADLNGDGRRDLLGSGDGKRLEIQLGNGEGFSHRAETQPLDTGGRICFGDLDGDGQADFVIYDPRRPGTPIRVGRSRMTPSIAGKR